MLQKILIFIICLAWPIASYAAVGQEARLEDRIIGSVFKTAAKVFLLTANIEEIKVNNIKKLSRMDEEKFRRRYAEVYPVLKRIPILKIRYGVTENMSKGEAIAKIQPLEKKEIEGLIDDVPDAIIAEQFKIYLSRKKEEASRSDIIKQINQVWNKMLKKTK